MEYGEFESIAAGSGGAAKLNDFLVCFTRYKISPVISTLQHVRMEYSKSRVLQTVRRIRVLLKIGTEAQESML